MAGAQAAFHVAMNELSHQAHFKRLQVVVNDAFPVQELAHDGPSMTGRVSQPRRSGVESMSRPVGEEGC
jgi:hypothetical protein